MDKAEAGERFAKANELYRAGKYNEALVELNELTTYYPQNPGLLDAKARTLEHLGQYDGALLLYDRLLNELGYEKARPRRDRVAGLLGLEREAEEAVVVRAEPAEEYGVEEVPLQKPRRFRIKPIRLAILVALVAGMYFDYVPDWLGIGLIAAYFIIKYAIKFAVGALMRKLFTMPFKMKGKALAGATVELHGYEWTDPPASVEAEDDDAEEEEKAKGPLRFVWLDVTITPPVRTQGFTHWEPGELALAPSTLRYRSIDDMDKCFQVRDVKFINDGVEENDEGYKVHGPQRIKVLAGIPFDQDSFRFAYYFETFGDIRLKT